MHGLPNDCTSQLQTKSRSCCLYGWCCSFAACIPYGLWLQVSQIMMLIADEVEDDGGEDEETQGWQNSSKTCCACDNGGEAVLAAADIICLCLPCWI